MKRRPPSSYDNRSYEYDYERAPQRPASRSSSSASSSKGSFFNFNYGMMALLGGVLILGIAIGIILSLNNNTDPKNVTSSIVIDRSAPNPELCQQYGASAIVTDMRVFITLNPFKVFVTQPQMQPGCVLRTNNWTLLEKQNLVTQAQVNDCKKRMNTFGFTGSLDSESPDISCIYPNDEAGNLFLNKPGSVEPARGTENF